MWFVIKINNCKKIDVSSKTMQLDVSKVILAVTIWDGSKIVTIDIWDVKEIILLIVCNTVLANGLIFSFDVKTTLNVSDLTFYPSQTTHSYDIYASAQDKEDILFLNLLTGKLEYSVYLI